MYSARGAGIPPLPLTLATEGERQQLVAAMRDFHPSRKKCLEERIEELLEMLGSRTKSGS